MSTDSNVANRSTTRQALSTLLENEIVTATEKAAALHDHQIADFEGVSPVVVVSSAGSHRSKLAFPVIANTRIYLDVHIFVAYTLMDDDDIVVFDEEDSENRLDLLEKQIMDVLIDNNVVKGLWSSIELVGKTEIDVRSLGGVPFRHERIPLVLQSFSN